MNDHINPEKSSSIVGHHTTCNVKTKHNYPPLYQSGYIYCRNPFPPMLMLFHKPQPWVPWADFVHQPPHSSPCSMATTCLHRSISFNPKCHNHLPKMFSLKVTNFFSPNPPLAIGVQTVSYPTKCSFKIIDQSKHLTFYYIEKYGTTMASSQEKA